MSAVFFGLMAVVLFSTLIAEITIARTRGEDWYDSRDSLGNLNLAAGNVLLGSLAAVVILGGIEALYTVRIADLSAWMPVWAFYVVGFVLTEFIQYWSHRLAHLWTPLAWGHLTHHSSPHMNLTTSVRINWIFRFYMWIFYFPLPLLGYDAADFLLFQSIMNAWNLFQHTRLDLSFGPLEYILVSPQAHRLHHASNPEFAGNYGGALIIFDRLFGTYRSTDDESAVRYGMQHNVYARDPVVLNGHILFDHIRGARARGESIGPALLGISEPEVSHTPLETGPARPWHYIATVTLVVFALAINAGASRLPAALTLGGVVAGILAILIVGRQLDAPQESP